MGANTDKKVIRMAIWLLHKKLGKSYSDMENDLKNCGNDVFREMYNILLETSEKVDRDFQRNTTLRIGTVLLWILYRDTAYRDITYDALRTIILSDDLTTALDSYWKPANEWMVNVWSRSKKHTEELSKKGKIAPNQVSLDEEIFIHSKQKKKLEKL